MIFCGIHNSFTCRWSISWNFSVHMQWGKTMRTMISTCFSRQWNFFSTVYTLKCFINLFHIVISFKEKEPNSRNRTDLSPKVIKVGSSYQSRKGNTGSQEQSGKFDTISGFALLSPVKNIYKIFLNARKLKKIRLTYYEKNLIFKTL